MGASRHHGIEKSTSNAYKKKRETEVSQNQLILHCELQTTDFGIKNSHQYITKVMHKINMRLREKLNFLTPSECFYEKYRKFALAS